MFNGNASGLSASDVLALSNNDGAFGGNNGILWFVIILFALFGGWGGNGWNGNGGTAQGYTLASDFANLQRQIDSQTADIKSTLVSIGNGISSLGYDQLAQMNGINTNILTTSNATQNAINNCCCNNREGFATVNYNLATQSNGITNAINSGFCNTNFNMQSSTRDIVDSQNAGTRAILDKLCAMESNAKDERIAELQSINSDLRLQASQSAQNQYLVGQLRPSPIPSYQVANPYCNCGYVGNGYFGTTIS